MTESITKRRLLSGMQPTGKGFLHLGNLEGALRPWIRMQDNYEMFCFVADWHALTMTTGESIVEAARQVVLDYLSAGLDPQKCTLFRQSSMPQHAELALLLGMVTPVSWLERVPTYKEKRDLLASQEGIAGASFGLLGYPVLQAADILIYRPHVVPVGKDQAAHLELTREIARRFHLLYDVEIFPEPQAVISDETGILPGLDGRKMSKSYGNALFLTDTPDTVAMKIQTAFTSPGKVKKTDPGNPEGCSVCQLRRIYDTTNYATQWDGCRTGTRGCVQSKRETTEIINEMLAPIRTRRTHYAADPAELDRVLAQGTERASAVADETLGLVRTAMKL